MADAPALGAGIFDVGVQVPSSAPKKNKTNPRENLEFVLFYTITERDKILLYFIHDMKKTLSG